MKNNHTFQIFIAFLCIALASLLYTGVKTSRPEVSDLPFSPAREVQDKNQENRRAEVEGYIQENITNLSDEKAVLGGTFYVTDIIWEDDFHGTVFYEDGHYALKREFTVFSNESGDFSVTFDMIVPE